MPPIELIHFCTHNNRQKRVKVLCVYLCVFVCVCDFWDKNFHVFMFSVHTEDFYSEVPKKRTPTTAPQAPYLSLIICIPPL